MNNIQISQISSMGMDYERNRLEMATLKISLANMTFSSLVEAQQFADAIKNDDIKANIDLPIKTISDKKNPNADEFGNVYKFEIDPTHEMATLISATRAYEANVRAYNANSQLNAAALDIGAK